MNILFITADQWRAECLSVLDHPVVRTPNIDQLAKEGVLFSQHYAQAAPCSPSRVSLHTGMYLHNHRVCINGTPLDIRHTNWALEATKAGYSPQLFGYTDTALDPRGLKINDHRLKHFSEALRGMNTDIIYQQNMPLNWISFLRDHGYRIPANPSEIYSLVKSGTQWEDGGDYPLPSIIPKEHQETRFMVDLCIDWIRQQNQNWIAHLSLLRPHPPFVAPEPYNQLYDPHCVGESSRRKTLSEESRQHPWLAWQLSKNEFRASSNATKLARFKSAYYGLMSEVDDCLGDLFQTIHDIGQWQNTLIIFTSDHGEQMGDHWMMSKGGYFDESYHIPLIIRDPKREANTTRGSRISRFTENIDIMPTMLEWLGLNSPSQCDGSSLLPLIRNPGVPTGWRNEVHWEYDFRDILDPTIENHLGINQHQCALNVIRDEKFKYVHFTALPPLFFDLELDPGEFNNVAGTQKYAEHELNYAQKMISWRMNHDDRALTETILCERGPVTITSPVNKIITPRGI